jgi:hypothetical protein
MAVDEHADDLDALFADCSHGVEIDATVLRQREGVIDEQPAEALVQLGNELTGRRHSVVARPRVEAGDHETVDIWRRPGERHVDDSDAPPGSRQPCPE